MNQAEIMHTQRRVGTVPDGYWGPQSTKATQRHLQRIAGKARYRFPSQADIRTDKSVFGPHGVPDGYEPPMTMIRLPFQLHLYGDSSKRVATIRLHEECADAFLSAFQRLAEVYPDGGSRKESGILDYYGTYNPRSIRGGSVWSMHAYGVAIDLDANRNRNRSHWPVASKMPIEVMECFAQEGILSAGAFWNRDAMHFQSSLF